MPSRFLDSDKSELHVLLNSTAQVRDLSLTRMAIERNRGDLFPDIDTTILIGPEYPGYWSRIKSGFRTAFRTQDQLRNNIDPAKLLEFTEPGQFEHLWEAAIKSDVQRVVDPLVVRKAMIGYGLYKVTIGELNRLGVVSLGRLDLPFSPGQDIGELRQQERVWRMNMDPENLWGKIKDLEQSTGRVIYDKSMFNEKDFMAVLQLAQFATLASQIAGDVLRRN